MLVWTTMPTPIGRLLLMATDIGVVRVAFDAEGMEAVRDGVAARLGDTPVEDTHALVPVVEDLEEYFQGRTRAFEVPLDWSLASGFYRTVEQLLDTIPYGQTLSYSELAARAGRPRAHRAAASACARNPLPLLAPCHRIVRSDGGLGGYLGGLTAKRLLLDLEKRAVE